MDAAYPDDVYVDDRTIDSHIKRLRRKFRAVDRSSGRSRRSMARLPLCRGVTAREVAAARSSR